ncbi:hypothetical protein ACFSL6_09895 [Paenibacillus thailandensis]|uniref:ABC transporter permease n=1 Tax=Paenibacillus thailandensis TaxID=393250 RepID=A0ABW5R1K4_9BACL
MSLIRLQHLLYFRWFVSQFTESASRLNHFHVVLILLGVPLLVSFIGYYLFRAIFLLVRSGGIEPAYVDAGIAFSLIYLFLGIGFVFGSYRETYIRAFHSKDWEFIRIHHGPGRIAAVQAAKLFDVYLWHFVFPFVPLVVSASLAFNGVFQTKIPAAWYTYGIVILAAGSLAVRMLAMLLSHLYRRSGERRRGAAGLAVYFAKTLVVAVVCYGIVKWMAVGSFAELLPIQAKSLYDWLLLLTWPAIPTNWLLYGRVVPFVFAVVASWAAVMLLLVRNEDRLLSIQNELPERIRRTKRRFAGAFGGTSAVRNLLLKDLILLYRDVYRVMPHIRSYVLVLMALGGIGLAIRDIGWIQSPAVSFSALFAAQLFLASFASDLVARVTSVDAEGMMMSVLLTHLRSARKILLSKFILHFCLITALVSASTILLALVMGVSPLMFATGLLSMILINLVSSMGLVVSTGMYPRFDWEDESKINTSEKAGLTESLLIRTYELANVTVTGTSGALLFGNRLDESAFFAASLIGLIATSAIWLAAGAWLLNKPWWKGWRL